MGLNLVTFLINFLVTLYGLWIRDSSTCTYNGISELINKLSLDNLDKIRARRVALHQFCLDCESEGDQTSFSFSTHYSFNISIDLSQPLPLHMVAGIILSRSAVTASNKDSSSIGTIQAVDESISPSLSLSAGTCRHF